jgi:hypothetical protein
MQSNERSIFLGGEESAWREVMTSPGCWRDREEVLECDPESLIEVQPGGDCRRLMTRDVGAIGKRCWSVTRSHR